MCLNSVSRSKLNTRSKGVKLYGMSVLKGKGERYRKRERERALKGKKNRRKEISGRQIHRGVQVKSSHDEGKSKMPGSSPGGVVKAKRQDKLESTVEGAVCLAWHHHVGLQTWSYGRWRVFQVNPL